MFLIFRNFSRWTSKDLVRTVMVPFQEKDSKREHVLDLDDFYDVLTYDFGSTLSFEDIKIIAKPFASNRNVSSKSPSPAQTSLFRSSQSAGYSSIRGRVSGSGFNEEQEQESKVLVEYPKFVISFVELFEEFIEANGGVSVPTKTIPWVVKEFWLFDFLLSQLEVLDSRQRRRQLMTFQYALISADPKQVCIFASYIT